MSDELFLQGRLLDLKPGTRILPSFQVSDLLVPDKIQSDFSPEIRLAGTQRNHAALGHADRLDSAANTPHQALDSAAYRCEGADALPRARLLLKGYEAGEYKVQLFAGNRRLVDALGDKTLQDLDLSRFNHSWSLDNVATRATPGWWALAGWGYELYDRGRPFDAQLLPYTELVPSAGARLLWEQMLLEAGFTAEPWQSPLLRRLRLPAVALPKVPEAERTPRRLRAHVGPGHARGGRESANRNTITATVPFDDTPRLLGNVPPLLPKLPGVFVPSTYAENGAFAYRADRAAYVRSTARVVVNLEVPLAKASAQLYFYINGVETLAGPKTTVDKDSIFSVGIDAPRLLLAAGDELTAVVKLRGEDPRALGTKWGFELFAFTDYRIDGQTVPGDKFEVQVLDELPPGGEVSLSGGLPAIKQLDFFKMICQLGGLSCRVDAYENHLLLWSGAELTANAPRAHDWSAKRDQPDAVVGAGQSPRAVAYRLPGAWAQRSYLRWLADPLTPEGYGDGLLEIDDANLPAQADVVKLPFAATPDSAAYAGLLSLPAYALKENEDPFAPVEYDKLSPKPRLSLGAAQDTQALGSIATGTYPLVLTGGPDPGPGGEGSAYAAARAAFEQRRPVLVSPPYFMDQQPGAPSLELNAYVLPVAWRGVRAMTRQARLLTERYRLSAADLADFLARPDTPVWDAGLGGYFAVRLISEFDPNRPTEVELARLHPELLAPPAPALLVGSEWYGLEFYTPSEFY